MKKGNTVWIIGNTQSGKSTLAKTLIDLFNLNVIHLDGDMMRSVWTDLSLSREDRILQNIRIAKISKMLNEQGFDVIISSICPYEELRTEIKKMIDCKFIYVKGGLSGKEYPFENPVNPDIIIEGNTI